MGTTRTQFEAGRTYTVKFLHNGPPATWTIFLGEADKDTSYRLSYCIGADTVAYARSGVRFGTHDGNNRQVTDAAHEVFSFEELNQVTNMTGAFYRDGEWLHVKLNELNDRRLGGTYTEIDGHEYDIGQTLNLVDVDVDPFDLTVNYPSVWPYHVASGQSAFEVILDDATYDGVIDCQPFVEPTGS